MRKQSRRCTVLTFVTCPDMCICGFWFLSKHKTLCLSAETEHGAARQCDFLFGTHGNHEKACPCLSPAWQHSPVFVNHHSMGTRGVWAECLWPLTPNPCVEALTHNRTALGPELAETAGRASVGRWYARRTQPWINTRACLGALQLWPIRSGWGGLTHSPEAGSALPVALIPASNRGASRRLAIAAEPTGPRLSPGHQLSLSAQPESVTRN